jgi:hypothetical protein
MGVIVKDDGWRITDELWERIEPLPPPRKPHPLGCHNPRVSAREVRKPRASSRSRASGAPLGSRTHAQLDESLPAITRLLGETS